METKPYEQQIDEIMDCFDFKRVHEVMKFLNWQWLNEGVPDEYTLRKYARGLLRDSVKHNYPYQGCGGFEVTNEDGVLSLAFVIEEWNGEDVA